jgi:hypothetical protein
LEVANPSNPSAEYLIELSLASFAKRLATYSSVKISLLAITVFNIRTEVENTQSEWYRREALSSGLLNGPVTSKPTV